MKFSIKRKNKISLPRETSGSALFLVLTFALLSYFNSGAAVNDKDSLEETKEFTSRYVFENTGSQALELLTKSMRLDMLDYWDADSVYKVSNVMGGLSWLDTVSENYLKVIITPVSYLEIKILPVKKGKLAMTVYTVGSDSQASDSQIDFYDENLEAVPLKNHFEMPDLKDFFEIPKGSATNMKEIREMIPFPTVAYSANPDNDNLSACLTVENYINLDDWNILKLFLKPSVTLEWKKDKYRVVNSK